MVRLLQLVKFNCDTFHSPRIGFSVASEYRHNSAGVNNMLKKADLWLLAIVVAIAMVFIIPRLFNDHEDGGGKQYARITVDGKLFKEVELSDKKQEVPIETKFGYNLMTVFDGGIEMTDADCPDKLCLTFGHVKNIGQTIVCLPNRVMVEIIGDNGAGGEIDGVAS
jgi:hypothetical protein